jgi:tRNA dimethylallyltransferase
MLDLVEPDQRFTVADFQRLANLYIKQIYDRRHLPFVVGGSGLYIDSLLFDYEFVGDRDERLRRELNQKSVQELQKIVRQKQIAMPENAENKRYLIRAIEINRVDREVNRRLRDNTIVVGITTPQPEIEQKIRQRAVQMLSDGFIDEVRGLVRRYGDQEPFRNNLYGVVQKYLSGEITEVDLVEQMVIVDRQLVKKQLTWFKRNPHIKWLSLDDAENYISGLLSE